MRKSYRISKQQIIPNGLHNAPTFNPTLMHVQICNASSNKYNIIHHILYFCRCESKVIDHL